MMINNVMLEFLECFKMFQVRLFNSVCKVTEQLVGSQAIREVDAATSRHRLGLL